MGRRATWVVVAGVLLVGGAAAVEAFLGDGEATADQSGIGATTAPTQSSREGLTEQLEAAGARGLLYMTVEAGDGCELQAVRLPRLTVERAFPLSDCRFAVAGAPAGASSSAGRVEFRPVRVEYDAEADAAYITLVEQIGVGGVAQTLTVTDSINLDFDQEGKLVGIEVLAPRSLLRAETINFAKPS